MTPLERRARVESICDAALNLARDARPPYVRQACGDDPALLADVEALLAHASQGNLLEPSLGAVAASVLPSSGPRPVATLPPGTRFGVYEVVSLIDAGGMGQVYRARDTDLGREVALKVLRPDQSADLDRLARFEHEARMLAALNHPNIAAIHGVERGAGRTALVMELVDGTTLNTRIDGAPVSIAEAQAIVRQLVAALAAAHDRGIVHRDLKPSNVILSPTGHVKVLDFGLAKVTNAMPAAAVTQPDAPETGTGVVMGTAAYMSPEQARGEPVDKRTDIWALGCVWFELLTGARAFRGGSSSETLAAVLREDPDWSRLPADLQPRIRAVLSRCLAKNRNERLADVSTIQFVLDEAGGDRALPSAIEATVASVAQPLDAHRARTGRRWPVVGAAVAAALLLGAVASWQWNSSSRRSHPPASAQTVRSAIVPPPGVTLAATCMMAFSGDGTLLVYVGVSEGRNRLFKRRLAEGAATPIDGTEGATFPFFSPDSQWLGFISGDRIRKVRVEGGPIVTVAVLPAVVGATWGADGFIVAGSLQVNGLSRVAEGGGTPEPLTTITPEDGSNDHRWPQALPQGRGVLFSVATGPEDTARIVVLDARTRTRKDILTGSASAAYVATGHLAYARRGELLVAPFDLERLEITGPAVRVAEGVNEDNDGTPEYAFSTRGDAAYAPGWSGGSRGELVLTEMNGTVHETSFPRAPITGPRFSPDGRRVALMMVGAKNNVWLYDVDRATAARLTAGRYYLPKWTADGRLLMSKGPPGRLDIVRRNLDAEDADETLITSTVVQHAAGFTADGRLVFERRNPATQWDILFASPGSTAPTPLVATPANEQLPHVSPDGRWIAYISDQTGRREAYVRGVDPQAGRQQVSTNGAGFVAWARDGRTLYVATQPEPAMWAVPVVTAPMLKVGNPVRLFASSGFQRSFDVSPDGSRFAMVRIGAAPPRDRIELIQNALAAVPASR